MGRRFVMPAVVVLGELTGCVPKSGGPCAYRHVREECRLETPTRDERVPPSAEGIVMHARYVAAPHPDSIHGRPFSDVTFVVKEDRLDALHAYLDENRVVPCSVQYETEGTCRPFTVHVELPPPPEGVR